MKHDPEKFVAAMPTCKSCDGVGWVWKLASGGQHGGTVGRRWMRCTSCRGYGIAFPMLLDALGIAVKPKPSAPLSAAPPAQPGPTRAKRSAS